jgi:hypothetical protein
VNIPEDIPGLSGGKTSTILHNFYLNNLTDNLLLSNHTV